MHSVFVSTYSGQQLCRPAKHQHKALFSADEHIIHVPVADNSSSCVDENIIHVPETETEIRFPHEDEDGKDEEDSIV